MKIFIYISAIVILFLGLESCYYDNGSELLGGTQCDTTAYAYQADVQPILDNFCVGCHNIGFAEGAVRLDEYSGTILVANDGRLVEAINHTGNARPMPENAPKLNPCAIRTIELWIEDGALNN